MKRKGFKKIRCVVSNDLGDEVTVMLNLRNEQRPNSAYNGIAIRTARLNGLPDASGLWEGIEEQYTVTWKGETK